MRRRPQTTTPLYRFADSISLTAVASASAMTARISRSSTLMPFAAKVSLHFAEDIVVALLRKVGFANVFDVSLQRLAC